MKPDKHTQIETGPTLVHDGRKCRARRTESQRSGELAIPEPSVALMLQQMVEAASNGKMTTDNVAAIKEMVGLYSQMEAKKAEKDFSKAFAKLQSELKRVQAVHIVPDKQGNIKYRVAKFEEVWNEVEPLLLANGFTARFAQRYEEGLPLRVTTTFILQHTESGHKTETPFTVRVGNGPPGCTDYQADGAASSYAKMRSMCSSLNIIIEQGDDARMVGKPIGKGLAEDLMNRVRATRSDEAAFLRFAGVALKEGLEPATLEDYEQISDERYESLDEILRRKEGKLI